MIDRSQAVRQVRHTALQQPVPNDHRAWAKHLQLLHQGGAHLNPNQVRCYRNALGLNVPTV